MKKIFGILLIVVLLSSFVSATIEKPSWKSGLFWKYNAGTMGNLTIKIVGQETIKFNFTSTSYKVWNLTQIPENGEGKRYTYVTENDFSIVKEVDVMGKGKKYEIIYMPPAPTIKYKMDIGDVWHGSYKMMEYDGREWHVKIVDITVKCMGKEKVKIPLGTYECYKILQEKRYGGNESTEKTILYYSPHFGNWIKMEAYSGNVKKVEMVLINTNYAKENKTPFPSYMMIVASAISILLIRSKRKMA